MKKFFRGVALAAGVVASGGVVASAAQDDSQVAPPAPQKDPQSGQTEPMGKAPDKGSAAKLNRVETSFVEDVARMNQGEIQLAQLGVDKAQSDDVRNYAQQVLNDHRDAGNKLQTAIEGSGATLPQQPTAAATQVKNQLARLNGQTFDRQFMTAMIDAHQKSINLIQINQNRIQNTALQGWVTQTLPVMQRHLSMAESVQSQILSGKQGGVGGYESGSPDQPAPQQGTQPAPKEMPAPQQGGDSDSGDY